jgi:predicted permease
MHSAFYDQLLDEVRRLPAVQSAGITNMMPMTRAQIQLTFQIPGRPPSSDPGESPVCGLRLISPGFFRAMASPIVDGRDFADQDRESNVQVVIINEALARRYFSDENPVGRQVDLMGPREIVGIVGDIKPQGLDSEPQPEMYLPYHQFGRMLMMQGPLSAMSVVVRTAGDPLTLVEPIRSRVASIDPQLPIFNISTMERRISDSVAQPRFYATLFGIFAGLAVILAAVGVYGVLSYHVAQCTRELGIRMAMGAQRSNVLHLVLRQGVVLAVCGIIIGLAGAWGTSRFLTSLLFGVTPTDPTTYAGIAVLMVVIAVIAAYIPARRATAVDPVVALRYE